MTNEREVPRGASLAAGTFVLFINGIIYSWSIYSSPFSLGFGWTSAQLGLCFTLIMAFFCIGGLISGFFSSCYGAGPAILAGGILSCLGYMSCMFLYPDRIWLLYTSFILVGLGVGAVYNAVISTVVLLFPEKKGTAAGVLMMGFGSSALILGSAAASLIADPDFGWHLTYIITGILLLFAAIIGRILIVSGSDEEDTHSKGSIKGGMPPSRMVKTPQFALMFLIITLGTAYGTGIIGHSNYIVLEGGAEEKVAAFSVGLVAVFNGLGRVLTGALYDKKGPRWSLGAGSAMLIAAAVLAVAGLKTGLLWLLMAAMPLVGLGFGSMPVANSIIVGELFGKRHYAANLAVASLNVLPASFAAAGAGAIQTVTNSYSGAFIMFCAFEIIAAVMIVPLSRYIDKAKGDRQCL